MSASIQKRLRLAKDVLGWKRPWHEHFKVIRNGVDQPWDPDWPPIFTVNCSASECVAPGCPRTESGYREPTSATGSVSLPPNQDERRATHEATE